jgi:hypothetical protein
MSGLRDYLSRTVTYVVTLKCVPKVDIVEAGFGFQLTGSCKDDAGNTSNCLTCRTRVKSCNSQVLFSCNGWSRRVLLSYSTEESVGENSRAVGHPTSALMRKAESVIEPLRARSRVFGVSEGKSKYPRLDHRILTEVWRNTPCRHASPRVCNKHTHRLSHSESAHQTGGDHKTELQVGDTAL